MARNTPDPKDQTFRDWIPFIEVFDRSCEDRFVAGRFGNLHFRFPCTGSGGGEQGANEGHKCQYGIRVRFTNKEVLVSLYDDAGDALQFGNDPFDSDWESSFGSLLQPDPKTEMGKAFANTSNYFEQAAIRIIPFLSLAYRISPAEAAEVHPTWSRL